MSSEQPELKDAPAHVEHIASYTPQDEKDHTLFHRKGSNDEFVDEKATAAAHGGYDAHEETKDEKVLGLRKTLFKMLVHAFLWLCFTGMFLRLMYSRRLRKQRRKEEGCVVVQTMMKERTWLMMALSGIWPY
jgi:hypothetical protein